MNINSNFQIGKTLRSLSFPGMALSIFGFGLLSVSCQQDGNAFVPELTVPPSASFVLVQNRPFALVFQNRGGIASECTVEPALPGEGLAFRTFGNTCVLEGIPTASASASNYRFIAGNESGTSEPLTNSVEIRQATAFFSHLNGNLIEAGTKFLGTQGSEVSITLTNSGFGGDADNSCQLSFSANDGFDTDAAFSGYTSTLAENGLDCIIAGTTLTAVPESVNARFTVTTATVADEEAGSVAGMDSVTFGIVLAVSQTCASVELPNPSGTPAYPVPITGGGTAERLYIRGNHSNWSPQDDFLFVNKGNNTLQVVATFDAEDAAEGYEANETQFKLASDDDNWATQLWVSLPNDENSIRIGGETPTTPGRIESAEFGMELPVTRAGAGVDNNWAALATGGTYSFLFIITDTTAGDGPKGTLTIQQCAP